MSLECSSTTKCVKGEKYYSVVLCFLHWFLVYLRDQEIDKEDILFCVISTALDGDCSVG